MRSNWGSAMSGMGFSTLTELLGPGYGDLYTVYDTMLSDASGVPLRLPSGDPNPAATPGAAFLSGPATLAAYGELLPTDVLPFALPPKFDASHLSTSVDDTLMKPSLAKGVTFRAWSSVDQAVLTDLGYEIVPEPGSLLLVLACAPLLGRRRRRR